MADDIINNFEKDKIIKSEAKEVAEVNPMLV